MTQVPSRSADRGGGPAAEIAPKTPLLPHIQQAVAVRYRDLADPWYGWVQPAYDAMPYKAVVDDLEALGAAVEAETDLNDEVSCRYFVRRDGVLVIAELSLVGPYAVVWASDGERSDRGTTGPLTPGAPAPGLGQDVLTVLQAHGLHVLDLDILRTPLEMPFSNVEAGYGTLYQALIADTPAPWTERT